MSALSRFLNLPASRRTYSSYFSSKSGGGRYFNSAKAPKVAVVAPNANSTNANAKNESSASADSQQQQDGTTQASASSGSLGESQAPSGSVSSPASEGVNSTVSNSSSDFSSASQLYVPPLSITAKDFKMHHFFSLHRPLLLLNEPASIFRGVAPNQPLFPSPPAPAFDAHTHHPGLGLGETPYDPFVDADAEAARQLTRALTMARAESALSWEKTLKHLGLDVTKDADRVGLQERFEKDWEDVLMDSTKRKRRKKMKKHKCVFFFDLLLPKSPFCAMCRLQSTVLPFIYLGTSLIFFALSRLKKRRRATRSERLRMK
ncbi:hypothetical protein BDN70DRAFT_83219 [Pholiota conissans]|uniref:Uncharacterized protein n=1 Tax=Pholiota conissans TaxID=109636 RepID=A0A9P5ZDY5_9AGAR|nr:hypothetical protein BDN70DRAFT_83219 [Pholiota conissans]